MGTALATGRLAKGGNIPWRQAGLCILAALIGSWAGARLALLVDPEVFKRLMLVILPLTALYLLRSRPLGDGAGDLPKGTMTLRAALIALGVGVYDGFYGPGTGTFLLLLLTGFARFKLGEANGVAKSINLTTNHVVDESSAKRDDLPQQLDLFTNYEEEKRKRKEEQEALDKERRMQEARLAIKRRFGKNAILKGLNFEEGATAKERNAQIGGHKA